MALADILGKINKETLSRIATLEAEFNEKKKKLEEDIEYVEKVARDSMGVTREGEIPIKIEQ